MKNITLSADDELIQAARKKASTENTTLNQRFREWLRNYTNAISSEEEYNEIMKGLSGVRSNRKFTREELNER